MKENTQEKSIVRVNTNSIFYKIKMFFKNIFSKSEITNNTAIMKETNVEEANKIKNNSFREYIKNIEDEETKLLKLQKQYRNGEITEKELTDEQVMRLCELYDRQIANLRKSNEMRKERLREYKKRIQIN